MDFYENNLPPEAVEAEYADTPSRLFPIHKIDSYGLLNKMYEVYKEYCKELAKNRFTKEAIDFVNGEIVKPSVSMSEDFEVLPNISFKRKLSEYSDSELFLLGYFLFPTFNKFEGVDKQGMKDAMHRLKNSNCDIYENLASVFKEYIK